MSFVRKFIACLISIALLLAQLSATARGASIDVAGNGSVLSLGINGSKGSASKKWTSPSGIATQGSLDVIVENATISGGQIEVTSQTGKQTARQLASLNRNADKSLEITSVIDEGFELYISDTSIKAVGKIARVFFREINELVTAGNISPEQADILRKITACGGQQGFNSWNPLNWIITPAYAEEDCSDITLKELTQQIDVETLKQLIDVCKDPILKAEAQYLLTMVLKKDLSSNDIYALEHFNPWDIEGLKKLSPEALEVVKVLSDLLSCTSPYCILKRQSIESQWDSNLLQIITFAHMNVPKSTPIGIFKTDGLTFSEYLTAVQTEELISIGVGFGIGKAFASAIIKLKIVPTLAAKLRNLLKGGADKVGGSSRVVPGGGLRAHENAGGHLIERHVGKTDTELSSRLSSQTNISAASSFPDRATAKRAVSSALDTNSTNITSFLNGSNNRLVINHDVGTPVGNVMTRGSTASVPSSNVRIVVQRDPNMATGYRIVTGFPTP